MNNPRTQQGRNYGSISASDDLHSHDFPSSTGPLEIESRENAVPELLQAANKDIPDASTTSGARPTCQFGPSSVNPDYTSFAHDTSRGRLQTPQDDGRRARHLFPISETHPDGFLSSSASAANSSDSAFETTGSTVGNVSFSSRAQSAGKKALTVERMSKVETAQRELQPRSTGGVYAKAPVVLKWLVTILVALVLLACLVITRLEVLVLSRQLNTSLPIDGAKGNMQEYMSLWIVMYFFLSVPVLFNMLRASWFGLLDRTVPWPRCRTVLLAMTIAALESLGLCLICYKVLGMYDAPMSLMLLHTPAVFSIVENVRFTFRLRRRGETSAIVLAMAIAGAILGIAGVVPLVVQIAKENVGRDIWHLIVGVVSLSVAWMPALQKKLVTPLERCHDSSVDNDQTQTLETVGSSASTTERAHRTRMTPTTQVPGPFMTSSPSWKVSFYVHSFKLLFIFVVSSLLLCLDTLDTPGDFFTASVHTAFLDAWSFSTVPASSWKALGWELGAGLVGYTLFFSAYHMNMTRLIFIVFFSSPLALIAVGVTKICDTLLESIPCGWGEDETYVILPSAILFFFAHVLAFGWYHSQPDRVLLQKESVVFWVPGYSCISLDTWLLLNHCPRQRRWSVSARYSTVPKVPKVFICTTMYREDEEEMRQVLQSINDINLAQAAGSRSFESHIILDGGVRQREPTQFALQLLALLKETLDISPEACTKVETPYGIKLTWALPSVKNTMMPFSIHLKDNFLVKNKKRWSQVMYMSYVLDFLSVDEYESFILTTDADVVFKPDSVEALLDLMTRDDTIGAVCARTHPMGSGPLVWYQVFEYAIGHWFQKAAEHVLGSVLCAPGCFSVYRCSALADVIPTYARRVESAFDFLTKDMGEDRWLCTLLVQSGWRIEYCAASENSTNCPNEFEEFYKQRRRWVASTIANLMLIIKEWKFVRMLNHRVSNLFLMYQGLLLFSTLIGPSTNILIVSGGLYYAWNINSVAATIVQYILSIAFAVLCVYATQPTQIKAAKIYTFFYSIAMTAVVVGTVTQLVEDVGANKDSGTNDTHTTTTTVQPNSHISVDLPLSVTTLYLAFLAAMFVLGALLHFREFFCLVHGIWYLLCLPSGYLVLIIYSICNITDSSWGTREQTEIKQTSHSGGQWMKRFREFVYDLCFCCVKRPETSTSSSAETQTTPMLTSEVSNTPEQVTSRDSVHNVITAHAGPTEDAMRPDVTMPISVEEWLSTEMKDLYAAKFRKHGFDTTLFITGMTESELRHVGVKSQGHLHYLLSQIALVPAFEIEYRVPKDVDEWLSDIGLERYINNFHRNKIRTPKEMEILKSFRRRDIELEIGITKLGHMKRLIYAISRLKDPTERQQKAMQMRQIFDDVERHFLKNINADEYEFWENLIHTCLKPDLKAFGLEAEVKAKLADLRDGWLLILAVSNTLWLILISSLAVKAELFALHTNPLGLAFVVIYGALFFFQFLAMCVHRLISLSHLMARAPYRCGKPFHSNWSFKTPKEDTDDLINARVVHTTQTAALERLRQRGGKRSKPATPNLSSVTETSPLIV